MALIVPNPTVPTNGQSLDATPLLANLNAVYQAIQAFDAGQISAGTLVAAAFNANINPNTILNETIFPFVYTGLSWSTVSGLNGTMTAGTAYINNPSGQILRVPILSIASNAFTANKDTYVYVDYNGNITYSAVANNAASPSAPANAILLAIVVTGGAAISTINQGNPNVVAPVVAGNTITFSDTLGNLIYPADPQRKVLGYRQILATVSNSNTAPTQIPGLSLPVILPNTMRRAKAILTGYGVYGGSTQQVLVTIWDGTVGSGTQIGESAFGQTGVSGAVGAIIAAGFIQPGALTKTYNGSLYGNAAGSNFLQAVTGAPAALSVELD